MNAHSRFSLVVLINKSTDTFCREGDTLIEHGYRLSIIVAENTHVRPVSRSRQDRPCVVSFKRITCDKEPDKGASMYSSRARSYITCVFARVCVRDTSVFSPRCTIHSVTSTFFVLFLHLFLFILLLIPLPPPKVSSTSMRPLPSRGHPLAPCLAPSARLLARFPRAPSLSLSWI